MDDVVEIDYIRRMGMDISQFQEFLSGSSIDRKDFEYTIQKHLGNFDLTGEWPEISSMWHIRTGGSKINPNTYVTVCGIVSRGLFTTITVVTPTGVSSGDFLNPDEWHATFSRAIFAYDEEAI